MNDFGVINNYMEWNKALWEYFFPNGNENPILYIDNNILQNVGESKAIRISTSYEDDFLSKVLLSPEKLRSFDENWAKWRGVQPPAFRVLRWDQFLIKYFINQKMNDRVTPAYFAVLCSIMYLACSGGANHDAIRTKAIKYLGADYEGNVGQIADILFQQLHDDISSFDADREASLLRNIGKIKYHSILKPAERNDFIDFLEINHLKWESEPYEDFVNYRLIPALSRAGKESLINLVTQSQFIPYVKNILNGHLNFDRTVSEYNNSCQTQDVVWSYELSFDIDGESSFCITTFSYIPFPIELKDGKFVKNVNSFEFEYLADNTELCRYEDQIITDGSQNFLLHNIVSKDNEWPPILYFEYVGNSMYHQVDEMQEGRAYLLFCKKGERLPKKIKEQSIPTEKNISVSDYTISDILCYQAISKRQDSRTDGVKIKDKLSLQNIGSWFSVCLNEKQDIYWKPNLLGKESELKKVDYIIRDNGRSYFWLPRTTPQQLSVKLFIKSKSKNDFFDVKENVTVDFEWDGETRGYFLDGWGEATTVCPQEQDINVSLLRRMLEDANEEPTAYSDMLLQILYDSADSNGCVTQKKLVAALNFVFGFFNIDDNKTTRKSVIYALKRLGYIISYYDHENRQYLNQLVPCFLERTNYSVNLANNEYLIKGIYSREKLKSLLQTSISGYTRYKRPYDEESLHYKDEYRCLPDLVLLDTFRTDGWKVLQYPVAEELIRNMSNMSDFSRYVNLDNRGDVWMSFEKLDPPCMVKDKTEFLCTRDIGSYKIHRTFIDQEGFASPIPKHLARAYCQNFKDLPICVFEKTVDGEPATSKITFLSGMGKPYIVDMALCDLSLGLPASEYAFVVNNDDLHLTRNDKLCVESKSYQTGSYHGRDKLLLMTLQKLGTREIADYENSSAVFLCENQRRIVYGKYALSMEIHKNTNYQSMYVLRAGGEIISFCETKEKDVLGIPRLYYKDPHLGGFVEVEGTSLNQKISDVITRKMHLDLGSTHSEPSLEGFDQIYKARIILKK